MRVPRDMKTNKQLATFSIATGLSIPALFVAFVPPSYLLLWLHVLFTFSPGIGSVIFMLGLTKASLLLGGLSKKIDSWSNGRTVQYGIGIHVVVGIIVLISILSSKLQSSTNNLPMEVTYAFIATEMLIFPVIGLAYLARSVQSNDGNYATVFLLSAVIYLDIVLVIVSDILMNNQTVTLSRVSALEMEGAKISLLLGAFASFTVSPTFWDSHSFYSINIIQIPNWVGAVYAMSMATYLYRTTKTTKLSNTQSLVRLSANQKMQPVTFACNLLAAALLGLLGVTFAHLILPLNVIGDSIQLLLGLGLLAFIVRYSSRRG